jgi:patatin-like phospholipase/acyl hydrolase
MEKRLVLAIDGGGLRGIVPAAALAALEQQTGRPARETFSFIAGTSTGAIVAGALAAGIPASQLVELYARRSEDVFKKRPWSTLMRILRGRMYSTKRLREVIGEEMGTSRDMRMDEAPVDVLITAKRLRDGKPWYFVRSSPRNSGRTGHLRLADCITASTAEPTYFDPYHVAEDGARQKWEPIGALVGGGVGVAGNPVYQACVEAFYYSEGYAPADTIVVSLGTGRYQSEKRPGWIWQWLEWVLGELLRSPGEQQTELVQRHFPEATFYRVDTKLPRAIPLDDIAAMPELRSLAERFAASVPWAQIIAGEDNDLRVRPEITQYEKYAKAV